MEKNFLNGRALSVDKLIEERASSLLKLHYSVCSILNILRLIDAKKANKSRLDD